MESRAKVLGHPLHQMLIAFPLGLLGASAAFDAAGSSMHKRELMTAGYWMTASGIGTGLVAAVPGLIDYLAIPDGTRAKKIGLLHGVGNAIVLGLFGGSLAARVPHSRAASSASLALSGAGVLLALGTAWLGGELVDRLGVGVDDGANLDAPNSLTHSSAVIE